MSGGFRPLSGRRLLLLRPAGRAIEAADRLEEAGAVVYYQPITATEAIPRGEQAALIEAAQHFDRYDWVLFTSAEGVRYFVALASMQAGTPPRLDMILPPELKIAAVGAKTAQACGEWGRPADLVPGEFHAEGLVSALSAAGSGVEGRRFLLARAREGREVLIDELRRAGGIVDLVPVYQTVEIAGAAEQVAALVAAGEVETIVATSGAPLQRLAPALDALGVARESVGVAALGPVTAQQARELGFNVLLTAPEATFESLVQAMIDRAAEPGDDTR